MTVTLRNHAVSASRIVENEDATLAGTVTDLTTSTRYDHDGDGGDGETGTLPLVGTYTCGSTTATDCVVEVTGDMVTGITGPVLFTAAPDADNDNDGAPDNGQGITKAAVAADANDDYLVFGVWLRTDTDTTAAGDQAGVAAFADNGAGLPNFATPVTLYGTASYTGSATGLYTAGSSVDYFEGRARLTANFGDTPAEGETDDAAGAVTGTIDEIVAGGNDSADVINLRSATLDANGAFSGTARMGEGEIQSDDTVDYPYNGMWSGQFYGEAAESGEESTTTPMAVGGTFGVTGTMGEGDAAVTRSYLGAFGAYKDE